MANHFDELLETLVSAVEDGGRAARDRVSSLAATGDGLEVITPAYAALAAWRTDGFEEITRIALAGHTMKIKSAALTILSCIADRGQILANFFVKDELVQLVNRNLSILERDNARRSLASLVMDTPTEDLMLPISQSFMHYAMVQVDAPRILTAVMSSKWLRFGSLVLDRFENMLVTHANDEPAFQAFFSAYPQMLDPMVVRVWSQPDLHGAQEPDFVLQRADDTYLVVEIETPGKSIIRQNSQLTADATHAEKQVNEYATFLNERVDQARKLFPNYRPADKMAVIGMQNTLSAEQTRGLSILNEARHKLTTVGFDWLLDRARRVLHNVNEGEIQVVERRRML